jgi:hypothetical protein
MNTFETDVVVAREALAGLTRRMKGARPEAARAFVNAETDDDRDAAVATYGAGFIRRGLRETAVLFTARGDLKTADVFYALRDDIDPVTGEVFRLADEPVDA